ncbi:hypothetical protein HDU80_005554 [Chytriomyces hyalinus]|nr:hypothetical protein HDU80_005554 [Chytriomyces hyalinus]
MPSSPTATLAAAAAAQEDRFGCLRLSSTSACGPSFEGWPVVLDRQGVAGYKDERQFDSRIRLLSSTEGLEKMDLECTPDSGVVEGRTSASMSVLRFQMSFACMDAVFDALNGNMGCQVGGNVGGGDSSSDNPMGSVALMPKFCLNAADSHLQAAKLLKCDNNPTTMARNKVMRSHCEYMNSTLVSHPLFQQHASKAWLGIQDEVNRCGFTTEALRNSYCTTGLNQTDSTTAGMDPCCTLPPDLDFAKWDYVQKSWVMSQGGAIAQPPSIGSSPALVSGVVTACVAVMAVAGVAGFMYYRRRRESIATLETSSVPPTLTPLSALPNKSGVDSEKSSNSVALSVQQQDAEAFAYLKEVNEFMSKEENLNVPGKSGQESASISSESTAIQIAASKPDFNSAATAHASVNASGIPTPESANPLLVSPSRWNGNGSLLSPSLSPTQSTQRSASPSSKSSSST